MAEVPHVWPGRQWHVGETGSVFTWDIQDDGIAADLSNVDTVTFTAYLNADGVFDDTPKINAAACLFNVTTSVVTYQPITADMDTEGRYVGQLTFTMVDDSVITSDWFEYRIFPNLPG